MLKYETCYFRWEFMFLGPSHKFLVTWITHLDTWQRIPSGAWNGSFSIRTSRICPRVLTSACTFCREWTQPLQGIQSKSCFRSRPPRCRHATCSTPAAKVARMLEKSLKQEWSHLDFHGLQWKALAGSRHQQATKTAATEEILRSAGSFAWSRCWCSPVPCSWETGDTSKLPVGCWVGLIRATSNKIMCMFTNLNKASHSATWLAFCVSEWKLRAAWNKVHGWIVRHLEN